MLALQTITEFKISNLKNPRRWAAILKTRKTAISPYIITNWHEIWHGDAYWPSEPYWSLKLPAFQNSRWLTAAILKVEKWQYIGHCLTNWQEIWRCDAYLPYEPHRQLKIWIPKIQDGGWPPFWSQLNRCISAMVWPVAAKFDIMIHVHSIGRKNFEYLEIQDGIRPLF